MAVKYMRFPGKNTSINSDRQNTRVFYTNGSSARKFPAPDSVQNNTSTTGVTNSENIVNDAIGLRSAASIMTDLAASFNDSSQAVKDALGLSSVTNDPKRSPVSSFRAEDLENFQGDLIREIGKKIDPSRPDLERARDILGGIVKNSPGSFVPVNQTSPQITKNNSVPEIDYVSLDIDPKRGQGDIFTATLVFSVPLKDINEGKIRAVRIWRSTDKIAGGVRRFGSISLNAMGRLRASPLRSRQKNGDSIGNFENFLREGDVDNAATSRIPIDPIRGTRVSLDQIDVLSNVNVTENIKEDANEQFLSSFVDPSKLEGLDRSVILDLNTLRNIQARSTGSFDGVTPSVGQGIYVDSSNRVRPQQVRDNRSAYSRNSSAGVSSDLSNTFKEIAFVSPGKLKSRIIGDFVEYSFEDPTVKLGSSYKYYVSTIDLNMVESVRSRIVKLDVDGLRVPESPRQVSVTVIDTFASFSVTSDDQLVEKFEIYRKESDRSDQKSSSKNITTTATPEGHSVGNDVRRRLRNGFMQIGEASSGGKLGTTFYDRDVRAGKSYSYRFYAVDVFGNKSERPFEMDVFIPDHGTKMIQFDDPTITAEIDSQTGKIKITMQCVDSRVSALTLQRKDLSISQQAYGAPSAFDSGFLGNVDAIRGISLAGRTLRTNDQDLNWNGIFSTDGSEITFIDQSVLYDHVYQYKLTGIDKFGNPTSSAFSGKIFVSRRKLIDSPVALSATLIQDGRGVTSKIRLDWVDANIDITAEDRLGNRDTLIATSVRTLFQVQRKSENENTWQSFPMGEGTSFEDVVSVNPAPPFRPSYVRPDESYSYRVAAFQTGTYISNYCKPIDVIVEPPLLAPMRFSIRPADSKLRPYYVMLNWDTDGRSAIVDRWEIERAVVNNFASGRLGFQNPADVALLDFSEFRTVFAESSRFRERSDDEDKNLDASSPLVVGEHYFMDSSVEFGNSYFYRIRAVSAFGEVRSSWIFKGVKVTDETFEKKLSALVTPEEKSMLASSLIPLKLKSDYLSDRSSLKNTSLSLNSPVFKEPLQRNGN